MTQILLHEIIEQKLYHAIRLYLCESICVIFAPCYVNSCVKIALNDVICMICMIRYIVPLKMES